MPYRERPNHDFIESLFFEAYRLMNAHAGSEIRRRYDRLEHAYSQYVLALNCNDPKLISKRIAINKHLKTFIEELRDKVGEIDTSHL